MTRILLVEDEDSLAVGLVDVLSARGYEVEREKSGERGLSRAREGSFDLLLLDVELPGLSGVEILKALRKESNPVRILMLTARSSELDKVVGFDLGADDYVCKPFSLAELLGRIQALLRRSATLNSSLDESAGRNVHFGETVVDFASFKVLKQGRELPALPAKAFALLGCLVEKRGEAVTRDQLIDEVWGEEECITSRTLNNLIVKVRQAIESDPEQPRYLKTVHGVGYRLEL